MFLTATNLPSYLEDVGLVSAREWADGEVSIFETGRRNRNFRVHRTGGPSLFLKQVPALIAETRLSFEREAACARLATTADVPTLAAVMPRLLGHDQRQQVLTFELIEQGRSAADVIGEGGSLDFALIEAVAGTLARIHGETAAPGVLAPVAPVMPGEAPWIFIIGEKAEMVMPNMSPGCRDLVAQIRRTPELYHGLAQLGAGWRGRCLIHGDFKWDNLLVLPEADGGRSLRVADWELANLGDPLWDIAGVLGSLLQIWLLTPGPAGETSGGVPISLIHRAAARFWHIYAETARDILPEAPTLRRQAALLTGARMVLLAFELLPNSPAITPAAANAMELARYLLLAPDRALAELLGLGATVPATAPPEPAPWRIAASTPPSTGPAR